MTTEEKYIRMLKKGCLNEELVTMLEIASRFYSLEDEHHYRENSYYPSKRDTLLALLVALEETRETMKVELM